MKNKGFSFYQNFWDSIESLPMDQQKDVVYAIVKYGITGEMDTSNPLGAAMTQAFKISIDNSIERFNVSTEAGKLGGRPSKVSGTALADYLRENPKATAKTVAEHFGMSESAVQKREEWKNRKKKAEDVVVPTTPVKFDF